MVGYAEGYGHNALEPDAEAIAQAKALAQRADIVLVFAGLPEKAESEGFDRTSLDMPASHNALIAAVAEVNPATVVVLSNGAPVTMPWLPQVNAVLECYLGGQAWGGAVADLLAGKVSPSGKLAETFPASLEGEPCHSNFPGGTHSVAYAESVYVGYRYYDSADRAVLFPFGHGLSYSRFVYSDLHVEAPPGSTAPDADAPMRVTLGLRNVGAVSASEVVQLYVHDRVSSVFRPTKELKGFAKVWLAPRRRTSGCGRPSGSTMAMCCPPGPRRSQTGCRSISARQRCRSRIGRPKALSPGCWGGRCLRTMSIPARSTPRTRPCGTSAVLGWGGFWCGARSVKAGRWSARTATPRPCT